MTGKYRAIPLAVTAETLADMLAVPGCYSITASRSQTPENTSGIASRIQHNSQRKNIVENSQ